MLIWVCALHCEAKAIIDFYRLKKSQGKNAFDLYRADNIACIISGTGKVASAAACAWVAARYQHTASIAWINLGIAGADRHEIGALFLVNQIKDADTGQRYYPAPGAATKLPVSACLTLSQPGEVYRDDSLFDMEASGFIFSALRFSSAELIQCLKIVSDNSTHKTGKDRQRVIALVHQRIDLIVRQATGLIALNNEIARLEIAPESWRLLNSQAHFSQTQKNRLRVLWRYLTNRDLNSEKIMQQLHTCQSGSAVIKTLEQLCYLDSENL